MVDSHGRRRRRAVDGEQLLALGAAAVAEAGREARAEAGRAKEDGVGRAAVVFTANGVVTPSVSGFSGGRVKQHPIANPNRHSGEAFGVRTTWGWVQ